MDPHSRYTCQAMPFGPTRDRRLSRSSAPMVPPPIIGRCARSAAEPVVYDSYGTRGPRVVLVHGLLPAPASWSAQQVLSQRMRLDILVRRGYRPGRGEPADFVHDAQDLLRLLDGEPAHLVGHCYGALGCVLAAAHAPHRVASLTLIEPTCLAVLNHPALDGLRSRWRERPQDPLEFAAAFGTVMGLTRTQPSSEAQWDALAALHAGRPPWEAELPLADIANAGLRTLVFSGDHSPALSALADTVARQTAGEHVVMPGHGHLVQDSGTAFNERLEQHLLATAA